LDFSQTTLQLTLHMRCCAELGFTLPLLSQRFLLCSRHGRQRHKRLTHLHKPAEKKKNKAILRSNLLAQLKICFVTVMRNQLEQWN
jgi:hypothetical protein